MQNVAQRNNIHCKLSYDDQIRRFVFTGTEFAELKDHISALLGLPSTGFVLKYVDNESDLITLSSDEELSVAIEVSDKVLRLIAEKSDQNTGTNTGSTTEHIPAWRQKHGGRGRCGGRGRGRGGIQSERMDKWESQKVHANLKLDLFRSLLAQIPPDEELVSNPKEKLRKHQLQTKINRLEGRLLRMEGFNDKRMEKGKRKCEKRQYKDKASVPPEHMEQIHQIKMQISALKPAIYQLKVSKKQKKAELQHCLQTGTGDKDAVWQEILVLKEKTAELKKEIQPLKETIQPLKGKK